MTKQEILAALYLFLSDTGSPFEFDPGDAHLVHEMFYEHGAIEFAQTLINYIDNGEKIERL